MRSIDPVIKARLLQMQQTLYSNAQPSMDVHAIRPRTPIFHKRFWEESIVSANTIAQNTTIAIRKTGTEADRVYLAYASNGVLTVKSAEVVFPVSSMLWDTEQTMDGCTSCALVFNGSFVRTSNNKVEYRTDPKPWLFCVTSEGQLMAGLLGGPYESLSGTNVTCIDAIRGVASLYKDIDQGLVVFYIINGIVYYNQLINGIWQGQSLVSIAPSNAVSVHAERTFDWRVVLQVKDASGVLYEVFSKMAASGWNGHESLTFKMEMSLSTLSVKYVDGQDGAEHVSTQTKMYFYSPYALSPVFKTAENIPNEVGDYGYLIKLHFDELVMNTFGSEYQFVVTDSYGTQWHAIRAMENGRELTLTFGNMNNAVNPVTLSYTPGTATGEVALLEADSIVMMLTGLVPYYVEPPFVTSIENVAGFMEVSG